MSGETERVGLAASARECEDPEAALAGRRRRPRAATDSTAASGGASAARRAQEAPRPLAARPRPRASTPRSSLSTQPPRLELGGEAVDERTEADALDGPAHPGAHAPAGRSARRGHARLAELDQLAQHVVGARLGLLDPRDVLRAA